MLCKYFTLVFIIILQITSCNITGEIYPYEWKVPIGIRTSQEALDYVETYNYVTKYGVFLPDEFYNNGYGDCEDFALMFQYILETELSIEADLVGGYYFGLNILHMWVESNGIIYEPILGRVNNYPELYEELYRYKYPESIYMVRGYGGFIK